MLTMTVNGQRWRYDAETEQFFTWEQDGAADLVYRTYADWERIFPADFMNATCAECGEPIYAA